MADQSIQGDKGLVSIGGVTVAEINNYTFERSTEGVECTNLRSTHVRSRAGKQSASGSMSLYFAINNASQQALLTNNPLVLQLWVNAENDPGVTGEYVITVPARITTDSRAWEQNSEVTWDVQWESTDAWTEAPAP